ncbi:MAG TPA: hypothetical protein VGO65_01795 [Pseudolysinimonas sp.]|nr:hypothetical protein [Pseudolysinimonas sp.]
MEETISTDVNTAGLHTARLLRLALVFVGAVLGLLVLSMMFGSSSARADDGGDSPDPLGTAVGELVSQVAEPVEATVTAVSHTVAAATPGTAPLVHTVTPVASAASIASPVAALADATDVTITKIFGGTPLGTSLGTAPVRSLLDPVVALIDGTITTAGNTAGAVVPLVVQPPVAAERAAVQAVPAVTSALVSGAADGALALRDRLGGSGTDGSTGASPLGTGLLGAIAGAGFFVSLAVSRRTLATRAMPGSPVYATDSSPD